MTTPAAPVAFRLRRPYGSDAEFVEGDGAGITKTGMLLVGASARPVGVIVRFEITLRDGAPLFRGEGKVVAHHPAPRGDVPAGLEIRFTRLDGAGKAIIERALRLRAAAGTPAPPSSTEPIPADTSSQEVPASLGSGAFAAPHASAPAADREGIPASLGSGAFAAPRASAPTTDPEGTPASLGSGAVAAPRAPAPAADREGIPTEPAATVLAPPVEPKPELDAREADVATPTVLAPPVEPTPQEPELDANEADAATPTALAPPVVPTPQEPEPEARGADTATPTVLAPPTAEPAPVDAGADATGLARGPAERDLAGSVGSTHGRSSASTSDNGALRTRRTQAVVRPADRDDLLARLRARRRA